MEVLKKKLNFITRRSVGDVGEKSHLTKSKTKPPQHHRKHHQDEGHKKENKMKMKWKMMRRKVSPSPVPAGCFPVYLGLEDDEKERFVVKAEMANHPLCQILLEGAEPKYGLKRQGPISLPCDVDLFYKVPAEMCMDMEDSSTNHKSFNNFKDDNEHAQALASPPASWNFIGGRNRLRRKLVVNNNSYSFLNQSKLLRLNP